MSLKRKFILLISAIFIGLILVNLSTLYFVIFPTFKDLENREAEKNINRAMEILVSDIKDLDQFVYDWAAWDESYEFVKNHNQVYIDSNMYPEYSKNQNHDLYYYWDADGKPILNKELNKNGDKYISFDGYPAEGLPADHPFKKMNKLDSKVSGLIQTKNGPMIVAARPIITSKLEGPIRGILSMGRYLDGVMIESLINRSRLNIEIWSLENEKLKDIPEKAPRNLSPDEIKIIEPESEDLIYIYSSYPDIYGNPVILLRVSMPKDITNQGTATIKYGILMGLISASVIMIILMIILQKSILSPLSSLAKNIFRLSKREDVAHKFPVERSDELGVVARSVLASDKERDKAENILIQQNEILGYVAKKVDLEVTLNKLVRLIEKRIPESLGSILGIDEDKIYLNLLSIKSLPKPYVEAIKKVKIGPESGSCGTAVYHNKKIICDDISNDPLWVDYKDAAMNNGLKASWSFPINKSSGEVIGVFALYFSEARKPNPEEEKIMQTFANIAGIAVESRTVDDELIKSKKSAEVANEAKSSFLSRMSHELRTPMNAILGFSDLMIMDKNNQMSAQQKSNLNCISSSGRHLLELIDEILELSTIEAGQIKLIFEPASVATIIFDVLAFTKSFAEEHAIKISGPDEDLSNLFVYADETRIKEILINFMTNAVKYNSPNGTVALSVDQLDHKVRINVTDTGPGISQANLLYIFEPFNRLDVPSSEIEGTGIGLSIAKQLAERMNGLIEVESEVGKGSCFSVEFPLLDIETDKDGKPLYTGADDIGKAPNTDLSNN
ncbi:MAG: CHASE4 domain-containing protein [Nitrospinales bacterium]